MERILFFAVTSNALYRITQEGAYVRATKIKHHPHKSGGVSVDVELPTDDYLAVTKKIGLFFFRKSRNTETPITHGIRPEDVDMCYWQQAHTMDIVALFQNEEEAICCLNSDAKNPNIPEWTKSTAEVLKSIDRHPLVRPSQHPNYGFPEELFN